MGGVCDKNRRMGICRNALMLYSAKYSLSGSHSHLITLRSRGVNQIGWKLVSMMVGITGNR